MLTHPEGKGISSISLDPAKDILAAGCWDGSTLLHWTSNNTTVGRLDLHRSRVNAVVHAPDLSIKDELEEEDYAESGTLAVGSADGRISLIFPSS